MRSRMLEFIYLFANDTHLFYCNLSLSASKISQVELCLTDLHTWFCCNGLALNSDKSDCIILGTVHSVQQAKTFAPITSINAAGSLVPISSTIKTLGVTLDSHLTFEAHVKSLTKTYYFHIRALRHIRSSIDLETAKSVANAIVSSRLDYATPCCMEYLVQTCSNCNVFKTHLHESF